MDSSLLEEWAQLAGDTVPSIEPVEIRPGAAQPTADVGSNDVPRITDNKHSFRRLVRNAMFRLVTLAARENYDSLAANSNWTADQWADALDPLFVEQGDDAIGIDADARAARYLTILEPGAELPPGVTLDGAATIPTGVWWVRQILDDADGDHDWAITATIDLAESAAAEAVVVSVQDVGPVG